MVNGYTVGGTTTICTANGLRQDAALRAIGINLDVEFDEVYRDIPISIEHRKHWSETTRRVFELCSDMGLDPTPSPKMAHGDRCIGCGRCIFGCRTGAKWDSREFIDIAVANGARLFSDCAVKSVVVNNGKAHGVIAKQSMGQASYRPTLSFWPQAGLAHLSYFAIPASVAGKGFSWIRLCVWLPNGKGRIRTGKFRCRS